MWNFTTFEQKSYFLVDNLGFLVLNSEGATRTNTDFIAVSLDSIKIFDAVTGYYRKTFIDHPHNIINVDFHEGFIYSYCQSQIISRNATTFEIEK